MPKKRQPARAGTTTVYWLDEEDALDDAGSPVSVPLDFLADLQGALIRLKGFEIKVKGTAVCYYKRSDAIPGDYVFVVGTMSPRQRGMVYG